MEIREKGRRSLYYFITSILGFVPEDRNGNATPNPLHPDLCRFLEGRSPHYPWNRGCLCAHRGFGKTIPTVGYVLWRGIYLDGFCCKIIMNSVTNAQANYTIRILKLFKEGDRAGYLHWLYSDRLRPNLDMCNMSQFSFASSKVLPHPSITTWGIESKFESWHGDLVVLDDPEGSDNNEKSTSTANNDAAWGAYNKSIPLLSDQTSGQILVVATPHGSKPLVYRLRRRDKPHWQSMADNSRTSGFKFYWKPLTAGDSDESTWPARFPPWVVKELRKDQDGPQQYWLLEDAVEGELFDIKAVIESYYSFAPGDRSIIRYPGFEFDPDKVSDSGFVLPTMRTCEVRVQSLRFYLHFDPLHKTAETRKGGDSDRPSKAAISVVGVASDMHAFLIESWTDDVAIERQADKLFWFYRKYGPSIVTYESIGAQAWLPSLVQTWEKMNPLWGRPVGFGDILPKDEQLPRMSTRMVAAEKNSTLSKDYLWREILSPWVNRGIIHFRDGQHEIMSQLSGALDPNQPVDLLDCLSQGPILTEIRKGQPKRLVWQPPTAEHLLRDAMARRKWVEIVTGGVHKLTGYRPTGWRSRAP